MDKLDLVVILTLAGVLGVCEEGRGGGCLILRLVSGVLGIELVLVGGGAGGRFGDGAVEEVLIDGSDTLFMNKWSCL